MNRSLHEHVAALVAQTSDGAVTPAEAMSASVPLAALGVTSLAQMRLIDALEREFGVEVDLGGDVSYLDSVAALAAFVESRR
ncbi:Acyl carrier protein [Sinosporangium album]|uniref:Acyl carrier protein n=1 Tax=Sinosporangium album TaxID=504805 RepID=A0A1G7RYK0_9ACTN|nr:acyl carrier protein [Sinosporangium album]SDG15848.1 Acyl carrier protein [Sinosporangium album]